MSAHHHAPKLTPVQSSNLDGVHFDEPKGTLMVKFKNSGLYRFEGCTRELYEGLLSAKSAGGYFHQNIRGKLKSTKVDEPAK